MFTYIRQRISTRLMIVSATALVILTVILLTPSLAPAKHKITWKPSSVTETMVAGESKTVSVTFKTRRKLKNLVVQVSPELEPLVQVDPQEFRKIGKKKKNKLTITISAPAGSLPGTIQGTIQLKELKKGKPAKKSLARTLPVTIEVWQRVTEATSGVTFAVPPELESKQGEDKVSFADPSEPVLPALFVGYIIDTPPEIATLPLEEALERIARTRLEDEDFILINFHDGGIEVEARTFVRHHFFLYNAATNKAIEFTAGQDGFFASQTFIQIIQLVEF